MRRLLAYMAIPLAITAGALVVASPAVATDPTCQTATTRLIDRPDSGKHGDWAKDGAGDKPLVRTVETCTLTPNVDAAGVETAGFKVLYTVRVTDEGTFTTIAGKSPDAGVTLAAGITGKMSGGFTGTFKAAPGFRNYKGALNGKTFEGKAGPATGDWVKLNWGGEDFQEVTNLVDWSWSYWTCSNKIEKATEKWVNSTVSTGDITGKPCPSTAPSAAPSTAPSTAPSASHSTAPVATLPVTGSNIGWFAVLAAGLVAVGVGLVVIGRRRRFTD